MGGIKKNISPNKSPMISKKENETYQSARLCNRLPVANYFKTKIWIASPPSKVADPNISNLKFTKCIITVKH